MKTQTSARNRDEDSVPRVQTVAVPEDRDGQRLDNFLAGRLKGVPRSLIYRICRTGEVRVNGRRAKPDQRLVAGDEVRIPPVRVAEPADPGTPPGGQLSRIEAAIVHEDREFLVIDKPAGIASHGGSGVSFGAIELLRAARPRDTLELAHRLDRDTSGILVLTRKRSALTGLQSAIREGQVEKRYLALLQGRLPQVRLTVDAPLRKSILQGGERMVRVDPDGKPSRSRFTELERYSEASLVEVALETGRTHQIRVHGQHIGHPLAGDEKYGEREFNRTMRAKGLKRLFLHAARFEFALGERSYSFSTPLAPELAAVVDTLQRESTRGWRMIELVGFDGDDTLWHSEGYYQHAAAEFEQILSSWIDIADASVRTRLYAAERRNLALFGYGAKSMTLSMIEASIEITAGRISAADIHRIVALGKAMLDHPVDLLPGIRAAVEAVAVEHRVVLITKGDLFHQERKVAQSGLGDLFERIEIVSEKDAGSYARVIAACGAQAGTFAMVGNSLRSDIEPVIGLGGWGVHMPYHVTWAHELEHGVDEAHPRLVTVAVPDEIPAAITRCG